MTAPQITPQLAPGTGRLEGYVTAPGWDPYEDVIGPMYWRRAGLTCTAIDCAMVIESCHCNKSGSAHGGLLAAFADFSLFSLGYERYGTHGIPTIHLASDFLAPVRPGDLLTAGAQIIRETGSMFFARGTLAVGEEAAMAYSGILKKPRADWRPAPPRG